MDALHTEGVKSNTLRVAALGTLRGSRAGTERSAVCNHVVVMSCTTHLSPLCPLCPLLFPFCLGDGQSEQREVTVMEAHCVSYVWNASGNRWAMDGKAGFVNRAFLLLDERSERFRLVTDNTNSGGIFNCLVYRGMVCVTSKQWLQWRDAQHCYLLRFENARDCDVFTTVLGHCVPISHQRSSRAVETRLLLAQLAGEESEPSTQPTPAPASVAVAQPKRPETSKAPEKAATPSVVEADAASSEDSGCTDSASPEQSPRVSAVPPVKDPVAVTPPAAMTPRTATTTTTEDTSEDTDGGKATPTGAPGSPRDVMTTGMLKKKKRVVRKKAARKGVLRDKPETNERFSGVDLGEESVDDPVVIDERPFVARQLSSNMIPKVAPPPPPPSGSSQSVAASLVQSKKPGKGLEPKPEEKKPAVVAKKKRRKRKKLFKRTKGSEDKGKEEADEVEPALEKLVTSGKVEDENGRIELVQVPTVAAVSAQGTAAPTRANRADSEAVNAMVRALENIDDGDSAASNMELVESDEEEQEQTRVFALPASEQLTEDIIAETLTSEESLTIASGVFDERSLRFYCALAQFRAQSDPVRQRAIAMGILEMFILPNSPSELSISPPVRNGLVAVHKRLKAFYEGEMSGKAPRAAPDLFERAAAEVRAQVRGQLDVRLLAENKSIDFKKRVTAALRKQKTVLASTDAYKTKEDLLVLSQLRLKAGVQDAPGTLRFAVPRPTDEVAVKAHIESALAQWMDSGQRTLRKIITLANNAQPASTRNVSMLRSLARIDDSVEAWSTLEEQKKKKSKPKVPAELVEGPGKVQRLSQALKRVSDRSIPKAARDRGSSVADTGEFKYDDKEAAELPEPVHSSEESSEFVDINLDGLRAAERAPPPPASTAKTPASVIAAAAAPAPEEDSDQEEDEEEEELSEGEAAKRREAAAAKKLEALAEVEVEKTDEDEQTDEDDSDQEAKEREAIAALRALLNSAAVK